MKIMKNILSFILIFRMIVDIVLENIKGYNSWRIVDLITTNVDTKDEETLYETMLHGIEARIN